MHDYTELEIRHRHSLSGRERAVVPPHLAHVFDVPKLEAIAKEPFVGITEDGVPVPGLFPLETRGASTARIVTAARKFLQTLDPAQTEEVRFPIDSDHWRTWFNVHPNLLRHGLLLEALRPEQRTAALDVVASVMSLRGFANARGIMRLNEYLLDLDPRPNEYGEWLYFFSIFGNPSEDEPWGWQLDGHHLNLNCFVLDDHVVFTPSFMGSEPMVAATGRFAGTSVLVEEEANGLALARTLTPSQSRTAVLYPSILRGDLPPERVGGEGQMLATAFRDNAHVRREGVRADSLTRTQQHALRSLIETYVGWAADDYASVKMREVDKHLDDTRFLWMGDMDGGPFYYRVHSAVILIEYNHQSGTFFANREPSRLHAHTVMRTPNGNDYGKDLLRQHHERFIHTSDGRHIPRTPGHDRQD